MIRRIRSAVSLVDHRIDARLGDQEKAGELDRISRRIELANGVVDAHLPQVLTCPM